MDQEELARTRVAQLAQTLPNTRQRTPQQMMGIARFRDSTAQSLLPPENWEYDERQLSDFISNIQLWGSDTDSLRYGRRKLLEIVNGEKWGAQVAERIREIWQRGSFQEKPAAEIRQQIKPYLNVWGIPMPPKLQTDLLRYQARALKSGYDNKLNAALQEKTLNEATIGNWIQSGIALGFPRDVINLVVNATTSTRNPNYQQQVAKQLSVLTLPQLSWLFQTSGSRKVVQDAFKKVISPQSWQDWRNKVVPVLVKMYKNRRDLQRRSRGGAALQPYDATGIYKSANNERKGPVNLGLKVQTGALALFPQWSAQRAKKVASIASKGDLASTLAAAIKDPENNDLIYMNKLNPTAAYWQPASAQWQGTWVRQETKRQMNSSQSYLKRVQSMGQILSQMATPEDIAKKIPSLVRQVVQSNAALSTSGFGPIAKKGPKSQALYAGRWLNKTSGRIDLLPQANQKYINPLVRGQRLAYVQARILNTYNMLVDLGIQRTKLMGMKDQQFQKIAKKQIYKGLNNQTSLWQYNQKISTILFRYLAATDVFGGYMPQEFDARHLILSSSQVIFPSQLRRIYRMSYPASELHGGNQTKQVAKGINRFREKDNQLMSERAQAFISIIDRTTSELVNIFSDRQRLVDVYNRLNNTSMRTIGDNQFNSFINQLVKAAEAMTSSGGTFKAALKKLMKAIVIPKQLNSEQLIKTVEVLDSVNQKVNDKVRLLAPVAAIQNSLGKIKDGVAIKAPATFTQAIQNFEVVNNMAKTLSDVVTNYYQQSPNKGLISVPQVMKIKAGTGAFKRFTNSAYAMLQDDQQNQLDESQSQQLRNNIANAMIPEESNEQEQEMALN